MTDYSAFGRNVQVASDEEPIRIRVNEIPVLRSDRGELVCVPITHDAPTVAMVGARGTGKSQGLHTMLDRAYWYHGKRCAIINDYQEETTTWNRPNFTIDDAKNLVAPRMLNILHERPRPLPIVYLYPNTPVMQIKQKANVIKLGFSFKDIVNKPEDWLDLKGTERYFKNIKDQLMGYKPEEIGTFFDLLREDESIKHKNKEGGIAPESIKKMQITIENFIKEGIVNSDNISHLNTPYGELNPIIALYALNLVPSFVTSDLVNKDYYSPYFKYLINDIFEKQQRLFTEDQVWLFIDEINAIIKNDKKKVAKASLSSLATLGRPKGVGMFWVTQNYNQTPDAIKSNTQYLFALRQKSVIDAREILNIYNLAKVDKKILTSLKKFQVMAITNEKFICYSGGERYEISDEPIYGEFLPPLSLHKIPSKKVIGEGNWEMLPAYILDKMGVSFKNNLIRGSFNDAHRRIFDRINISKVRMPYFEFRKSEVGKGKGERKIVTINSITDLHDKGLLLISQKVKQKWFPNQQNCYRILRGGRVPKDATQPNTMPQKHHVEYDMINDVYRLVGSRSSPTGKGEWI